jgi:hypothetical protein
MIRQSFETHLFPREHDCSLGPMVGLEEKGPKLPLGATMFPRKSNVFQTFTYEL